MTQSDLLARYLAHIRIVMVNTTLPANIGSAARAMHTMGLTNLVLVKPKLALDDDAYAHAAGAKTLLDHVAIVDTLTSAIEDCHWVFATSSRQRHIPKPVLSPKQAATLVANHFESTTQMNLPYIAIVFGREDRGLTNDELNLADFHIQIPANPHYSVLNVAAAVQVIASYFYDTLETVTQAAEDNTQHPSDILELSFRQQWDEPPVTHAQQQHINEQMVNLLQQLGIYHQQQSKVIPQRVSRLLSRLQLDTKEYQLLQAMFATLSKKLPKL